VKDEPMLLYIAGVLSAAEVEAIHAFVAKRPEAFHDGRKTAGAHARAVKRNEQAGKEVADKVRAKVEAALMANDVFRSAARPKRFVHMLLSRYQPGMEYGSHVDDAVMGGMRTDLSFTLFLSEPDSYEGGALIIEGTEGETPVKLPVGAMVLYPSTTLHRVEPVSSGERLAVAGWVRSLIRSAEQREILFDLDTAIAQLNRAGVERAALDRLMKSRSNLLRRWVED
jgi:PKHD-type hydroxylase